MLQRLLTLLGLRRTIPLRVASCPPTGMTTHGERQSFSPIRAPLVRSLDTSRAWQDSHQLYLEPSLTDLLYDVYMASPSAHAEIISSHSMSSRELERNYEMTVSSKSSKSRRVTVENLVGAASVDLAHAIGDNVQLDGMADACGVITAISIKAQGLMYQVEWFHNGGVYSGWFDEFRLEAT